MSDPSEARACPEAILLAAFAEQTLDDATREEIAVHIADCAECAVVIAESRRFLEEQSDPPDAEADAGVLRHWWVAAAAAALFVPVMWFIAVSRDPMRLVKQLASERSTRSVEGRLAGFSYAPFPESRSAGRTVPDDAIAFRAAAERLGREAGPSTATLHARGVALLLAGDAQAALPVLIAAVRSEPEDARLWNDLAVAYIATGDRSMLSSASEAAARALALSETLSAAHFNRAAALERLGRADEALREYRRSLELERRSGWTNEVQIRISRLQN